jgi:hypothetical protein
MHYWMQVLLDRLRTNLKAVPVTESGAHEHLAALVEASERKFVSDQLRLGNVELACKFVFQLGERIPESRMIPKLFDVVVVWAAAFGQSDTVAPLARAAARKLREFQQQRADVREQDHDVASLISANQLQTGSAGDHGSESGEEQQSSGDEEDSGESEVESEEEEEPLSSESDPEDDEEDDEGDESGDEARRTVYLPSWAGGAGGVVVPEKLGEMLEHLEKGTAKKAVKRVEVLWREWRKVQNSDDVYSPQPGVGTESPGSGADRSSPSSAGSTNSSNRVVGSNGLLSHRDAAILGYWLECRGKNAQALELYQLHGLQRERHRLSTLQRLINPKRLDLIPAVLFSETSTSEL